VCTKIEALFDLEVVEHGLISRLPSYLNMASFADQFSSLAKSGDAPSRDPARGDRAIRVH
jgi:hypothetical protein